MSFEIDHGSFKELEMMRQTVDRAADSIFWLTRQGEIIYANDVACAERGYSRTEMLGMKIFDLDPDYQPGVWERHFEDLKRRGTITLETRHRTKSGHEYPIEVSANYALIGESELNFCFLRDITERKKAESIRRVESDLLKKFASRIPGVIYQFRMRSDGSSCFPFASDAMKEIYQVSPEELRDDASKVFEIVHPDDLESVVASIQKSAREMSLWRHEYRVKYHDGTVRWLLGNSMPEFEEDGTILWHGFITDVTSQKRIEELLIKTNNELEERVERRTLDLADMNLSLKKANEALILTQNELIQREKMRALGVLVAGVSHELNTPLGNSLLTSSSLYDHIAKFKTEFENGSVTKTRLNEYNDYMSNGLDLLCRNLNRAIEQLTHFKQVSVDQASERRRSFELKSTVADNISIVQPQFKRTPHQVIVNIPDGIKMDSYPGAIGQVITNLVLNSLIHGFSAGMNGLVSIFAEIDGESQLQLIVEDNGNGISESNLTRIFDPFFTTRMGQGGSGLGLNIVFNIVKSTLGGKINVASEEGQFTRFTILIPLTSPLPIRD